MTAFNALMPVTAMPPPVDPPIQPSYREAILSLVQMALKLSSRHNFYFPISTAFQPIVSADTGMIFAYEALVRTARGGPAAEVFEHVNKHNRFAFDLACRAQAIRNAAGLGLHKMPIALCININPNYVMEQSACIEKTLELAEALEYPPSGIILEVTEEERLREPDALNRKMRAYRRNGIRVAIDDFGAGFAGLSLLANLEADIVKIDMELVRNVHVRTANRHIIEAIVRLAEKNNITVIAEGVELVQEARTLISLGVDLMQGYFFAKPGFESLPGVAEFPTASCA